MTPSDDCADLRVASMDFPPQLSNPNVLEVRHKQARWHTEMYGYVFAAAKVGVTHRIRRDVMLYPGCARTHTP